ncbi:DMT family transporter [Edaphobacter sp. HDX4]|uniref:DMT family transporter n=1 Tax=Edaphobacter sp. HDX4 TaxID=2794064 RepID=UPI002FE67371
MILLQMLIAIATGAANPFQSGTNAELNKELGQPIWACVAVYAIGLVGMLAIALVIREPIPAMGKLGGTKTWAWAGGLISIAPTMAGLMLAQKMGSGIFTGVSITAALVTSVVLDHFGLVGLERHPATIVRIAGCGLMVSGVWLVAKS